MRSPAWDHALRVLRQTWVCYTPASWQVACERGASPAVSDDYTERKK
jgi:hypothetical protein